VKILTLTAASAAAAVLTLLAPAAAQAPAKKPAPAEAVIRESEAIDALNKMGAYLRTLKDFEVSSQATIDEVTDDGQKIQFDGTTRYLVRRPTAFKIEMRTDRKVRDVYFKDGDFALVAPRMKVYAQARMAGTIRAALEEIDNKYGIELPLEDLFEWGETETRPADLQRAFKVGYAMIGGKETDQYAFRRGDLDFQIWIQRGDQPPPLKYVITTRSEPSQPQFVALMTWNVNPSLTDAQFVYTPGPDDNRIIIATLQ
jgi:hypothetical protein